MDAAEIRTLQTQLKALRLRQRRERVPVAGLSDSSARVLGAVSRLGSPRGIADELLMASSNVAAALRELEAGGFVVRTRDAQDTRRVNVALTEAGRELVADRRAERDAWLHAAVEALLDAREQAVLIEAGGLIERLARLA